VRTDVVEVKLDGDPFTVCLASDNVDIIGSPSPIETENRNNKMATATKLSAKELRKIARENEIDDWDSLSLADLRAAVAALDGSEAADEAPAPKKATRTRGRAVKAVEDDEEDEAPAPRRRAAAKKAPAKAVKAAPKKAAPAKKAAAKKVVEDEEPNENGNPFKTGTNMHIIAEELIKGGKRTDMVKRLKKKIDLKPRTASDDYDEDTELDRRILIVGQVLRKDHGFNVVRDGRGADAQIIAEAP